MISESTDHVPDGFGQLPNDATINQDFPLSDEQVQNPIGEHEQLGLDNIARNEQVLHRLGLGPYLNQVDRTLLARAFSRGERQHVVSGPPEK